MKYQALVVPAVLALSLTAATSGGWAVITVQDLPTHFVAGQPTELQFKVRQHGAELMKDLEPEITASFGKEDVRVKAVNKGGGLYAATLTVPKPGQWSLFIDANWHVAETRLLPIPALAANARPVTVPERYRGKQLFVAKGCVTCHVQAEITGYNAVKAGPDLTGKKYETDYLKGWLANPALRPPTDPNNRMPNLELKPAEIAALVSFINNISVASK